MLRTLRIGLLLWRSQTICCQSSPHIECNVSFCKTVSKNMRKTWVSSRRRSLCTETRQAVCQRLINRSLVRISGNDASSFLQGLVTNDMQLFEQDKDLTAIYAMLLNPQGRVLYDLIIYRIACDGKQHYFLVECDKEGSHEFICLIQKYKIRKKVELMDVDDELSVMAVMSPCLEDSPPTSLVSANAVTGTAMVNCSDPRITEFGRRLITDRDNVGCMADDSFYRRRRYQIGLSEGMTDLPSRECFPLESNAVFLNAVSFSKGCYIGQELTARTHHTGVIRKRLMPVEIQSVSGTYVTLDGLSVENSAGKKCGKMRSRDGSVGLALLRISDVIHKGPLHVKSEDDEVIATLVPHIPYWWPTDQDEELKSCLKTQL